MSEELRDYIYLAFLVLSISVYLIYIWQERRKNYTFKFFALRDRLFRLAIEEKINENSFVYRHLLLMINVTILFSKQFKFSEFINSLQNKEIDHISVRFYTELEKQDKEVLLITQEFFKDFLGLLKYNNILLYGAISLANALRKYKYLVDLFAFAKSDSLKNMLKVYREYKRASSKVENIADNHLAFNH